MAMIMFVSAVVAQTPKTSGADTSTNKTVHKVSDTGFITDNIRQHILEVKLAQMAIERAQTPRVKEIAREIVQHNREDLKKLLVLSKGQNLQGVSQDELRQVMGDVSADSTMFPSDPRAAATSGNTVTDSLGSGSSGSGNVKGEDTGTLAKVQSDEQDANYSETGNAYIYNNQSFLTDTRALSGVQGRRFDNQWVKVMLRIYKGKMDHYNKAVDQVQDDSLKLMITQAIPKIRMHHGRLSQLRKGKYGGEAMDERGQRIGDDNNNRRNAPRK